MAELVLPDATYRATFLEAMTEFVAEGRTGDASMIGTDLARETPGWSTDRGFTAYVERLRHEVVEAGDPRFVTHTTWWWVEGGTWLGRIDLRHELNDRLREEGGHIGYDVRRSARRRGHATGMLRAVLPRAADRGIDPALITCDDDNAPSRRLIEACGGELDDVRSGKCRYWVPTVLPALRRVGECAPRTSTCSPPAADPA